VIQPKPVQLTLMECMWLLRRLRADKAQLQADMLAIEERLRGGHNGPLVEAHRVTAADEALADTIIRKLWVASAIEGDGSTPDRPPPARKK
jgi:hypothetical protein